MSLVGNEFTSAVSANQTIKNGTDNRDWDERCFAYVKEEVGLDVCHQESFKDNNKRHISRGFQIPLTGTSASR